MFKSQLETLNLNTPIERETPVNKSVTPTGGAQAWPEVVMPTRHDLFYDGHWQEAKSGRTIEIYSPGTQESLGHIADASSEDVDAAVRAAHRAFPAWRKLAPQGGLR